MDARELLEGPRARELCARAAAACDDEVQQRWCRALERRSRDEAAVAEFVDTLTAFPVEHLTAYSETALLVGPLADCVCSAMYWQPPHEQEWLLAEPRVVEALVCVAEALMTHPAAAWWTSPVDTSNQHMLEWRSDRPRIASAADELAGWRRIIDDEQQKCAAMVGDFSGSWWSAPVEPALARSSRALGGYDAVQLFLVEECQGDFDTANIWPLHIDPEARVCEIRTPDDWIRLVRAHPLDVTPSRRHDWRRVTNRIGTWLIPDWQSVASDYSGVHLTVAGYLAGATRALEVDDALTMIAGWNPDQTYWFSDVARPAGAGRGWQQVPEVDRLDWQRNGPS